MHIGGAIQCSAPKVFGVKFQSGRVDREFGVAQYSGLERWTEQAGRVRQVLVCHSTLYRVTNFVTHTVLASNRGGGRRAAREFCAKCSGFWRFAGCRAAKKIFCGSAGIKVSGLGRASHGRVIVACFGRRSGNGSPVIPAAQPLRVTQSAAAPGQKPRKNNETRSRRRLARFVMCYHPVPRPSDIARPVAPSIVSRTLHRLGSQSAPYRHKDASDNSPRKGRTQLVFPEFPKHPC